MKRILIVEDDKKLNDGIRLALKSEYSCAQAFSLLEARKLYREHRFHLILLDVNLRDGSGLELGANDYITKPFSLMVLRARVGVQLRENIPEEDVFQEGEFFFDFRKMEFLKAGRVLELSRTEQKLLRCLLEHKGRSVSRSQLIDQVWQGDTEYVDEHALTVVVNRLRGKLGDGQNSIQTVYGVGYTWVGM